MLNYWSVGLQLRARRALSFLPPLPTATELGGAGPRKRIFPGYLITCHTVALLAKALRVVIVPGLQRWKRGWSRGFPTVDAKWIAGARAENQVDISDRRGPRPWTHTYIHEIITQGRFGRVNIW